jgi:hypothetical protein
MEPRNHSPGNFYGNWAGIDRVATLRSGQLVTTFGPLAPRLDFGRGVFMRHVLGTTYEQITQGGTHLAFIEAEEVVYESTLDAARIKSRSMPNE